MNSYFEVSCATPVLPMHVVCWYGNAGFKHPPCAAYFHLNLSIKPLIYYEFNSSPLITFVELPVCDDFTSLDTKQKNSAT